MPDYSQKSESPYTRVTTKPPPPLGQALPPMGDNSHNLEGLGGVPYTEDVTPTLSLVDRSPGLTMNPGGPELMSDPEVMNWLTDSQLAMDEPGFTVLGEESSESSGESYEESSGDEVPPVKQEVKSEERKSYTPYTKQDQSPPVKPEEKKSYTPVSHDELPPVPRQVETIEPGSEQDDQSEEGKPVEEWARELTEALRKAGGSLNQVDLENTLEGLSQTEDAPGFRYVLQHMPTVYYSETFDSFVDVTYVTERFARELQTSLGEGGKRDGEVEVLLGKMLSGEKGQVRPEQVIEKGIAKGLFERGNGGLSLPGDPKAQAQALSRGALLDGRGTNDKRKRIEGKQEDEGWVVSPMLETGKEKDGSRTQHLRGKELDPTRLKPNKQGQFLQGDKPAKGPDLTGLNDREVFNTSNNFGTFRVDQRKEEWGLKEPLSPWDWDRIYKKIAEEIREKPRYLFVMDKSGEFRVVRGADGIFHHSSIDNDEEVAAAGELYVDDGVPKLLSDRSGHFQLGPLNTWQAVKQMQLDGFDVSQLEVDIYLVGIVPGSWLLSEFDPGVGPKSKRYLSPNPGEARFAVKNRWNGVPEPKEEDEVEVDSESTVEEEQEQAPKKKQESEEQKPPGPKMVHKYVPGTGYMWVPVEPEKEPEGQLLDKQESESESEEQEPPAPKMEHKYVPGKGYMWVPVEPQKEPEEELLDEVIEEAPPQNRKVLLSDILEDESEEEEEDDDDQDQGLDPTFDKDPDHEEDKQRIISSLVEEQSESEVEEQPVVEPEPEKKKKKRNLLQKISHVAKKAFKKKRKKE